MAERRCRAGSVVRGRNSCIRIIRPGMVRGLGTSLFASGLGGRAVFVTSA